MTMPMAKTVMSEPAWARVMPRSAVIWGMMPAIRNSVVSIRNVPMART